MRRKLFWLTLTFAAVGFGCSAKASQWITPGPTLPIATVLDQDGNAREFTALAGQNPVILGFFFTGCRTICPTQVAQLAAVQKLSENFGPAKRPFLILVSLDPLSDTPQSVRDFAEKFDVRLSDTDRFVMLTGEAAELSRIWQAFEQPSGNPAAHAAQFWVGFPAQSRWTRVEATATPADLLRLLGENAP